MVLYFVAIFDVCVAELIRGKQTECNLILTDGDGYSTKQIGRKCFNSGKMEGGDT